MQDRGPRRGEGARVRDASLSAMMASSTHMLSCCGQGGYFPPVPSSWGGQRWGGGRTCPCWPPAPRTGRERPTSTRPGFPAPLPLWLRSLPIASPSACCPSGLQVPGPVLASHAWNSVGAGSPGSAPCSCSRNAPALTPQTEKVPCLGRSVLHLAARTGLGRLERGRGDAVWKFPGIREQGPRAQWAPHPPLPARHPPGLGPRCPRLCWSTSVEGSPPAQPTASPLLPPLLRPVPGAGRGGHAPREGRLWGMGWGHK